VDGRSLRTLARVPAGAAARERWKAPYAVIPRAALQLTLADAVRAHPACRLHLDTEIREATPLSIIGITGLHPLLIIGADGIRSKVRLALNGHGQAQQSGNVAWRLRLPPHASGLTGSHPLSGPNPGFDGSGPFDASLVTACLGRKAHLIAYPLGAGGGLNLVVVGSGFGQDGSTLQTGDRDVHKAVSTLLAGWHPHIRATLDRAETLGRWPLVEVADGAWHDGTRILIGDAAHAMMPFAAQGAAMAIEDAYELADALPATEDAARLVPALDRFVMHRKARVARVRSRGAFNRFAYHASGPVRLGRDLVLSLRTPEALSGDFDWLYGYRSPGLPA
jgi:salicylate hydroxylase